jgi:hypothetical protein
MWEFTGQTRVSSFDTLLFVSLASVVHVSMVSINLMWVWDHALRVKRAPRGVNSKGAGRIALASA